MTDPEIVAMLAKGLEGLSLYEALDIHQQRIAAMQHTEEMALFHVTIYFTLVSAFLAAAYVVGSSLSRAQVFIGTFFFAVSASFIAWSSLDTVGAMLWQIRDVGLYYLALAEAYSRPEFVEIGEAMSNPVIGFRFQVVAATLSYSGILASLYFMWSVRHPKTE